MFPTTLGVLREKYPDKPVLIAAMGAIKKPDGSVRPIHDGTHFVQVNNGIQFTDKLDCWTILAPRMWQGRFVQHVTHWKLH